MSIADFKTQIAACHTVGELNSLLAQWSVLDGEQRDKEAVFAQWCNRREELMDPAERGHDDAVQPVGAFESRL